MEILTNPTYDQIHDGCINLSNQIKQNLPKVDYIIGLARGGLFPAVIISHILNVPMLTVHYSSKEGVGDNKNHENILPDLSPRKSYVFVDDIADSGKTLAEIFKYYTLKKVVIHTAVLYYKEHKTNHLFAPDWYWQMIYEDTGWICFPWEKQ
ncbi:MAG: phosphoribosyltransferase family protein [Candidatus Thermoplasmatota archaeon]